MDIQNILRQHQDILELIDKIGLYRSEQQVETNAFEIAKLLAQLAGIIKMHLVSEDQFVYPSLIKHDDVQVRNTADSFVSEMGKIAAVFTKYKTKYLGASKISADASRFLSESEIVLSALKERIKREDQSLYPLLK